MAPSAISLLLLFVVSSSPILEAETQRFVSAVDWGKRVGGWTDIPNAGCDQVVRGLGRYSVQEYNQGLRGAADNPIVFSGVVSAGRQVVSGIKYRIQISAVDARSGDPRLYVAVVVIRPWLHHMNPDLISFSPSPSSSV